MVALGSPADFLGDFDGASLRSAPRAADQPSGIGGPLSRGAAPPGPPRATRTNTDELTAVTNKWSRSGSAAVAPGPAYWRH